MMTKIEMQAMESIIGIHRELKAAKAINWEQRRYEIAKEILPEIMGQCHEYDKNITIQKMCGYAVEVADALIEELVNRKRLG